MAELKVISDLYKLIKWILPHISKFPRNYRYTLGDRIEHKLYNLLEFLIKARFAGRDKNIILEKANIELDIIRYFVRLCSDFKLFSVKQYGAISGMLNEIGSQIGGWKKVKERNA